MYYKKHCHESDKPKTRTLQLTIDNNDYCHLAERLNETNSLWKQRIKDKVNKIRPLQRAVNFGANECFDLLVQNGADINDDNTLSAVISKLCLDNNERYFNEIYKNPKLNIEYCFREISKSKYKASEVIAFDKLLKHPNITCTTINISTLLGYIKSNRLEIVQILLDKSRQIKIEDNTLENGLCYAIYCKRYEFVKFLLNCGANINKHANNYHDYNYDYTRCYNYYINYNKYILNCEANYLYPILLCVESMNIKMIQLLIDHKVDWNMIKDLDNILIILTKNAITRRYNNNTMINRQLNVKIANIFIDNGVKIDFINSNNMSPVRVAISAYIPELLQLYIDRGVTIKESDILFIAQYAHSIKNNVDKQDIQDTIDILIKHGCSLLYHNDKTCLILERMQQTKPYMHSEYNISEVIFKLIYIELTKLSIEQRKEYLLETKYTYIIHKNPNNNESKDVIITENIMYIIDYLIDNNKDNYNYNNKYLSLLYNNFKIELKKLIQ